MAELKHFFLTNTSSSERYTATGGGGGEFRSPPRDSRTDHGKKLIVGLESAKAEAAARETASDSSLDGVVFVPLALEGTIGTVGNKAMSGLDLDKLDSDVKGIRIVSVREEGDRQIATVAIPKDQLDYFERKIADYIEKDDVRTLKDGSVSSKPRNKRLVESIDEIRFATLPDFYTDADESIPELDESIWWEVWLGFLSSDGDLEEFKQRASEQEIEFSDQSVWFPETVVVLARGTLRQWTRVRGLYRNLAEFRRAKIVSSEFLELPPSDQAEFVNDLLSRTSFAAADAPAVTVLDTGINRGHPLLRPALDSHDTQAWGGHWTVNDIQGHGTEMAGIALFGPRLKELLLSTETVALQHRLESVKVLPDVGVNNPPDYGPITIGAMRKAEIASPNRKRTFCLAVTADDRDQHRPSLWSAAIDQAVVRRKGQDARLIAISAGNLLTQPGDRYPNANHLSSVQDPAQAWNALTVGAFTEMVQLQEASFKGWTPVAPPGLLSPASTTSMIWPKAWPIKPEVVLEGGNYATDGAGNFSDAADLSLLTTRLASTGATLGMTRATSPAAGQAARMAAIIQANYPNYWAETIRGMLVHNAKWTKAMRAEFPERKKSSGHLTKIPPERLRAYGWGVPNLRRSLACAKHIATMVIQDTIQPYRIGDDGKPRTHEMKFHSLPLPKIELAQISEESVEMRVTLSYFIEPSPGRKGWNVNHRYASHGLRFDVMRPLESQAEFQQRISRDFWDGTVDGPDKRSRPAAGPKDDRHWAIGEFSQTKGSIHSDYWRGNAGQLADSGAIAIFPITGWWRERPNQTCVEKTARYSLIVTIRTQKTELDVYNWVANEVQIPTEIITKS